MIGRVIDFLDDAVMRYHWKCHRYKRFDASLQMEINDTINTRDYHIPVIAVCDSVVPTGGLPRLPEHVLHNITEGNIKRCHRARRSNILARFPRFVPLILHPLKSYFIWSWSRTSCCKATLFGNISLPYAQVSHNEENSKFQRRHLGLCRATV